MTGPGDQIEILVTDVWVAVELISRFVLRLTDAATCL